MATIYRKTAKGQGEVESRALKLAPRFRMVLIMIDGRRTDEELLRLLPAGSDEALPALLSGGFIEPIGVTVTLPREAPPPPRPAAAPPPPVAPPPGFEQRRRDAARTLTELIGPMGDAVSLKIERAHNPDSLAAAIELAAQVLANTRGLQISAEFRQRFGGT